MTGEKDIGFGSSMLIVGANFSSSSMLFRENLTIRDDQFYGFFRRLKDINIEEALILSNVDRTEIIFFNPGIKHPKKEIVRIISSHTSWTRTEIDSQTYILEQDEAVKYFLGIACSLSSLVMGDPSVKEQITNAFNKSKTCEMSGKHIENLINFALRANKRVSEETKIFKRPVSIPAACLKVARDLIGNLSQCSALVIGTSEMAEMLISSLISGGLGSTIVSHPRPEAADMFARQLNCHTAMMGDLEAIIEKSDIVITSMNSRNFTLTEDIIKRALNKRRRKPILLIDTGVPGDVDFAVAKLEDAFLYSLNDLEKSTREGAKKNLMETQKAQEIIEEESKKLLALFPKSKKNTNDLDTEKLSIEEVRQKILSASNGDPDLATKMLLEELGKKNYLYGNFSSEKDPNK